MTFAEFAERAIVVFVQALFFSVCWNEIAPSHLIFLPPEWQHLSIVQIYCFKYLISSMNLRPPKFSSPKKDDVA